MIIKVLGLHHPFFRPVIRRILTVLVIALWGGLEFYAGNTGWAIFALALGAICVFAFFIRFDPNTDGDNDA